MINTQARLFDLRCFVTLALGKYPFFELRSLGETLTRYPFTRQIHPQLLEFLLRCCLACLLHLAEVRNRAVTLYPA